MNVNKNFLVLLTTVVLMLHATSGEDMKVYCVKWESFPPGNVLVIHCVQAEEGITVYDYNKNQSTETESRPPEFQDESRGKASLPLRWMKDQNQREYECHIETDERNNSSSFTIVAEGPCPSDSAIQNVTSKNGTSTGYEQTGVIAVVVGVVVFVVLGVAVYCCMKRVYCCRKRGQRRNNQADAENGTEMKALNPPTSTARIP